MCDKKIQILFVVSDFYQAGTERCTYEIDKFLDKTQFESTFLCLGELGKNDRWQDYYYPLHLGLGSKVVFKKEIQPFVNSIQARIKNKLSGNTLFRPSKNLTDFLDQFDAISFMGEYTYPHLSGVLSPKTQARSLIHIMGAKFQKPYIYNAFKKDKHYQFVSGFDDAEIEFELSEFASYNHAYYPLSITIENKNPVWKYLDNSPKKIGIFTRLSKSKPLDSFLYTFHLLLQEFPDIQLHIYGSGDPKEEGVHGTVQNLYMEKSVYYRGHQENITKTAIDDELNLIWYQGYNNKPGGFAGYDFASVGVPQLFWDFSHFLNFENHPDYLQFRSIPLFLEKTKEILFNKQSAEDLSKRQFADVFQLRNAASNVKLLERIYLKMQSDQ